MPRGARIALCLALLAPVSGCGGDDEPSPAPAGRAASTTAAASSSAVLGEYTQRLTVDDLPGADRASAGLQRLIIDRDSYEMFTPKGPGIAGTGHPEGENRYVFEADYRRDCTAPATYEATPRAGGMALRPVGDDPCELRRIVLTAKPWKRSAGS